jgi:peptidoglycan-N-acetylglucosamine deacetylase
MEQSIIPFHIAIGTRASNGAYAVHATSQGAAVTSELTLPDPLQAAAARLLEPGARVRVGDAPALGRGLGRALFAPPLRDMLLRSRRGSVKEGARLQIQLQIDAPELAALPWEWLTVGEARPWSPALRADYPLVRVGRRAPAPPPARLAGPLRVLAIAGENQGLELEALHAALRPALRSGRIELRLLRDPAPRSLGMALADDAPHILHCAAPIGFSADRVPQLMIGRGIMALDLGALAADLPELRLLTLAGAQGDAGTLTAAPASLAAQLLSADLPAAIVCGEPLPASFAAHLAAACYQRLAEGAPVDLAATAGRRALAELADGRGWGLVQLHMLPGGERLFSPSRERGSTALPRRVLIPIGALALVLLLLAARAIGARGSAAEAPTSAPQLARAIIYPKAALLSPTPAPTEPPSPTAAPTDLPPPTAVPAPIGYVTFLTADGDTLEGIAARLGSDAAAITALNHLDPQQPLRPQRPLVIPLFQPGAAGAGGLIIRRGDPARPMVALTFDIEIDDATLYGFLDILRARGIHGTFFLTGRWVQRYPEAARAIVKDGHEVGNHSLTHPYFSRIGLDGAASELEETERIIQETSGISARPYFRFPYGVSTADTAAIVAREGYVAYHWSADDAAIPGWLAWAAQNKAEANGGILLLHGRPSSVAALPGWLDQLAALGLQPATLGEVLR